MPENVVFTKRDEASKYASEVDGQVVGDDAGWRVMGIGYHEGGAKHDHPHSKWKEVMDFGTELAKKLKADPKKGKLVTNIMKNTGSTSDSMAALLLGLSKAKLEEKNRLTEEAATRKKIEEEAKIGRSAEKEALEYLERKHATGGMVDELGYMHGGVSHGKRDPIKYAAGGAVRGKRFVGSF